jgi:alpha-L-fucosidase 2
MEWNNGKLKSATILSKAGNPCNIIYNGKTYDLKIEKGKSKTLKLDVGY